MSESPTGGPRSFTTRVEEAVEAAALALAVGTEPSHHGQRCPVWTRKKDITSCDCWILAGARRRAVVAVKAAAPILLVGRGEEIAQGLLAQARSWPADGERAHVLRVAAEIARDAGANRTAEPYAGELAGERIARLCPPEEQRWPAPPKRPGWPR